MQSSPKAGESGGLIVHRIEEVEQQATE